MEIICPECQIRYIDEYKICEDCGLKLIKLEKGDNEYIEYEGFSKTLVKEEIYFYWHNWKRIIYSVNHKKFSEDTEEFKKYQYQHNNIDKDGENNVK